MSSKAEQVSNASLGSEQDGLVIFDLTTGVGQTKLFSPHTPKALLDLKLLGVGADRQRLSFVQIRTDLAAKVADNVTVPTLELADGSHLTDSWKIAEYLEKSHPKGDQIFGGTTAGKQLAAFLEKWTVNTLRPHYLYLYMIPLIDQLDEPSREYFTTKKVPPETIKKLTAAFKQPEVVQEHLTKLKAQLEPIDSMLAASPARGDATQAQGAAQRWLAGGAQPTHADFILFGWYIFSRISGAKLSDDAWRAHAHIARWVDDMRAWAGDDFCKDFLS